MAWEKNGDFVLLASSALCLDLGFSLKSEIVSQCVYTNCICITTQSWKGTSQVWQHLEWTLPVNIRFCCMRHFPAFSISFKNYLTFCYTLGAVAGRSYCFWWNKRRGPWSAPRTAAGAEGAARPLQWILPFVRGPCRPRQNKDFYQGSLPSSGLSLALRQWCKLLS